MKQILSTALALFGAISLFAQVGAPQGFNYQAVPRKFDGTLFNAGEILKTRFFILESTANGTVRFAEEQTLSVSPQGSVSAVVGTGNPVSGYPNQLQLVDWSTATYYLGISIDINGNNSFELNENFGATQLMSVPYALYAQKSANNVPGPQGPPGPEGPQGPPGPAGAGGIAGGGTVNYIPKFSTNGTTVGNSVMAEQSGRIGIGTIDLGINKLRVSGDTRVDGFLRLGDVSGNGNYGEIYATGSELVSSRPFRPSANGDALGAANFRWDLFANDIRINGVLDFGASKTIGAGPGQSLAFNANLNPSIDNARHLGNSTNRWSQIWATDGTINTSDARLKQDIKPLNYGLGELLKLRPVSYFWKDAHEGDCRRIGFVAQELQTVLPEVVRDREWVITDEEKGSGEWKSTARLGVAYSEIIPVAVAAIQEQQQQIQALRAENEALKASKANTDARLEALESAIRHSGATVPKAKGNAPFGE